MFRTFKSGESRAFYKVKFDAIYRRFFAHFLLFRLKYLDFCKFAICLADCWSWAQGLSKNVSKWSTSCWCDCGPKAWTFFQPDEPSKDQHTFLPRHDHLLHHIEGRDDQPWTPSKYGMLPPVKLVDVRENLNLIPALSYMSHHNASGSKKRLRYWQLAVA